MTIKQILLLHFLDKSIKLKNFYKIRYTHKDFFRYIEKNINYPFEYKEDILLVKRGKLKYIESSTLKNWFYPTHWDYTKVRPKPDNRKGQYITSKKITGKHNFFRYYCIVLVDKLLYTVLRNLKIEEYAELAIKIGTEDSFVSYKKRLNDYKKCLNNKKITKKSVRLKDYENLMDK